MIATGKRTGFVMMLTLIRTLTPWHPAERETSENDCMQDYHNREPHKKVPGSRNAVHFSYRHMPPRPKAHNLLETYKVCGQVLKRGEIGRAHV